jgi:hypothetical protein
VKIKLLEAKNPWTLSRGNPLATKSPAKTAQGAGTVVKGLAGSPTVTFLGVSKGFIAWVLPPQPPVKTPKAMIAINPAIKRALAMPIPSVFSRSLVTRPKKALAIMEISKAFATGLL